MLAGDGASCPPGLGRGAVTKGTLAVLPGGTMAGVSVGKMAACVAGDRNVVGISTTGGTGAGAGAGEGEGEIGGSGVGGKTTVGVATLSAPVAEAVLPAISVTATVTTKVRPAVSARVPLTGVAVARSSCHCPPEGVTL